MDEKSMVKRVGNKIGFGVLFVAACYVSMYILMEYSYNLVFVAIAAVLMLISAFLFLNALFSEKAKEWMSLEEEEMSTPSKEAGGGEFQLKVTKHMKEMESIQKEMLEVLKKQNTLLQSQIENLEHEIYMLSEKQVNQAKSIIKFNKENARQLAISERETLEHVMQELKKAIEDHAVAIPAGVAVTPAETAAVLEEVSQEELFTVSDLPGDDEYVVPEMPEVPEPEPVEAEPVVVPEELPEIELPTEEIPAVSEMQPMEEMELPEMPEDIDLTQLFDIPELNETPAEEAALPEMPADIEIPVPEEPIAEPAPAQVEPVAEPEPQPVSEPEPAPAADPLAGLSSDPNAMMSPEDIAKLLAAMGQ